MCFSDFVSHDADIYSKVVAVLVTGICLYKGNRQCDIFNRSHQVDSVRAVCVSYYDTCYDRKRNTHPVKWINHIVTCLEMCR